MSDSKVTPADLAASLAPAGGRITAGDPEGGTVIEPSERTFTQSEVEAIVRGRLAKFSDYDDLKAELDALKAETQTEHEREVAAAREEARAEALAGLADRLAGAEARALAAASGWHNPEHAYALLKGTGAEVKVGDDGAVDRDALKADLDKLATDNPHLVKSESDGITTPENAGIGVTAPTTAPTIADAWAADVGGR